MSQVCFGEYSGGKEISLLKLNIRNRYRQPDVFCEVFAVHQGGFMHCVDECGNYSSEEIVGRIKVRLNDLPPDLQYRAIISNANANVVSVCKIIGEIHTPECELDDDDWFDFTDQMIVRLKKRIEVPEFVWLGIETDRFTSGLPLMPDWIAGVEVIEDCNVGSGVFGYTRVDEDLSEIASDSAIYFATQVVNPAYTFEENPRVKEWLKKTLDIE